MNYSKHLRIFVNLISNYGVYTSMRGMGYISMILLPMRIYLNQLTVTYHGSIPLLMLIFNDLGGLQLPNNVKKIVKEQKGLEKTSSISKINPPIIIA
jgi:hypothetical protein